jgi:hypothetical protein
MANTFDPRATTQSQTHSGSSNENDNQSNEKSNQSSNQGQRGQSPNQDDATKSGKHSQTASQR